MMPWTLRSIEGSARSLHDGKEYFAVGESRGVMRRQAVECLPVSPALVLGSTQSLADVDHFLAARRGIEIVRRRSGGGAVWLHPDHSIWIDVWLPRGDALWNDDVGRAALWLGQAWVDACGSVTSHSPWRIHSSAVSTGVSSDDTVAAVFSGRFDAGQFGRQVCFLSTAPGEVFVEAGSHPGAAAGAVEVASHKAVGISQRRTRDGARFQCVLYRTWQPEMWADLFVDDAVALAASQAHVATCDLSSAAISDALVAVMNQL